MTIKELMTAVSDDLARFPKGWNTDAKEAFKALGSNHYERRQTKIWMLTIREPDSETDVAVSVFRSFAGAKKAMEEDIHETFVARYDNIAMEEVVERDGKRHAFIGDKVDWEITTTRLWD